jgi:hypothetical protein
VDELLAYFDFAVVEQCFQYDECDRFSPFVDAGKVVFEVEYHLETDEFCPEAIALGFSAMRKRLDLRVWRRPC